MQYQYILGVFIIKNQYIGGPINSWEINDIINQDNPMIDDNRALEILFKNYILEVNMIQVLGS